MSGRANWGNTHYALGTVPPGKLSTSISPYREAITFVACEGNVQPQNIKEESLNLAMRRRKKGTRSGAAGNCWSLGRVRIKLSQRHFLPHCGLQLSPPISSNKPGSLECSPIILEGGCDHVLAVGMGALHLLLSLVFGAVGANGQDRGLKLRLRSR